MNSKLKIRDASGWTFFNFGLLAFLFRLFSLIRPELLFSIFGSTMLSRASHKGKKIFYQDLSQNFYSAAAVKAELEEVQNVVTAVPQIGGAWCCRSEASACRSADTADRSATPIF